MRARPVPPLRSPGPLLRQLLLLAPLAVYSDAPLARAAASPPTEYEVKAAYLYNFARFVEWPADAAATRDHLLLGVIGVDPFGAVLDEIVRDRAAPGDRRLVVRRFTSVEEAAHAHILFICSSEEGRLAQILGALDGASVLTVGDLPRFAERGGMVALTVENHKVRFEINVEAVQRTGLKVSSQLLKLARIVGEPRK